MVELDKRVFHPTPPFATLLGLHLLLFRSAVWKLLATVMVLAPCFFPPPLAQFRPYGAHFQSSDFYGAGSSATAHFVAKLVIATINHGGSHDE
jgi:predicted cobalt transporter CbtA